MKTAYRIATAVDEFDVSATTIRAAIDAGTLPAQRNGRVVLLFHDDLVAWVRAGCPTKREQAA